LRLEDVDAFKKERPLLFEEDWKTLIRCDHQLVRFNLREIRIDGEVERYRWRERVLARDAEIKTNRLVYETAGIGSSGKCIKGERRLSLAGFRNSDAGNEFQRSFGGETFEPGEVSGLGQPTALIAVHWDPHIE